MEFLRTLWQAWVRFGQFLGTLLAYVVLTIFYFTLLVPYAVGITWMSDPLRIRQPRPMWLARQADEPTIEHARRQF